MQKLLLLRKCVRSRQRVRGAKAEALLEAVREALGEEAPEALYDQEVAGRNRQAEDVSI